MIRPARPGFPAARIRDGEYHRLPPALGAGPQHLDDRVRLVLVQLIDQRNVWPRPGLPVVAADRPEERTLCQIGQIPTSLAGAALGQPLAELWRLIDHRHRVPEKDHRLILLCRRAVNLRPAFPVSDKAKQADAGGQRRLPAALGCLDIRRPEAPRTVCRVPAEQRSDNEPLPGEQNEIYALELAAVELQHHGEKALRLVAGLDIP